MAWSRPAAALAMERRVDLDDVLEDLVEDLGRRTRSQVAQAGERLRRATRVPGARARLRRFAWWGSLSWASVFGGTALATELAVDGGAGTAAAVFLGMVALPAVPIAAWARRTRRRDEIQRHQGQATRTAREELAALPVDVAGDWKRLRRAQALVGDLATDGLVDPAALQELAATADQLQVLLAADRRATELGGTPSAALREQVGELADLLVALAVEAVEHRTEEVGEATAPATLRDATDRLSSLRAARREVEQSDAAWRGVAPQPHAPHAPTSSDRDRAGRPSAGSSGGAGATGADDADDDEGQRGTPMPG